MERCGREQLGGVVTWGGLAKAFTGARGIVGSITPPAVIAPNGTRVAWIATPGGAIAFSSDSGPTSACGVRTPMRTVASQPSRFHRVS